jgi:DNA segregation ATPase FtsK/SpoIIIE, S-DNA-T family
MAEQQQKKLADYSTEVQKQVGSLTHKMIVLGFAAVFQRMEEGPIIRTYFFKPSDGSLFSKILSKEEELAGVLSVETVRIRRDMGLVAIEVPRSDRELIRFDKCINEMFLQPSNRNMQLPLLMGQTPSGEYLFADLADQPHLLIAGATGSGKSIFTAQVISSLALLREPSELEFYLVDTKSLDLVLFEGLKHVRMVIKKVPELRSLLDMLLEEVRDRTEKMSGLVRNVREWNKSGMGRPMRYKILVIDEFADIVATDDAFLRGFAPKDRPPSVLSKVQRLAQISRAAGIHIIMATQRPSVKVVTGDIKTNFPARICFKLPSQADSRVVLDENGAEVLLGKGDYLYRVAGSDVIRRAHSAYISIEDIGLITAQHEQIRGVYASL